jgi:hypothetical protein
MLAFIKLSASLSVKTAKIQSHKNLSIKPQFFLIISTIQSKYIFNKSKTLSAFNFSVIVVNHIISRNITCTFFSILTHNSTLSLPFSET